MWELSLSRAASWFSFMIRKHVAPGGPIIDRESSQHFLRDPPTLLSQAGLHYDHIYLDCIRLLFFKWSTLVSTVDILLNSSLK